MSDADDGTDRAAGAPKAKEPGLAAERMLLFTDAVTAISLTLLVLPLVDLVPEAAAAHERASSVLTDHLGQFGSFLLSFAVIARMWLAHHQVFSVVATLDRALTLWNMGWLLSIVILPVPTEFVGQFGNDQFAAASYYTVLLGTMVCHFGMVRVLRAHPEALTLADARTRDRIERTYIEGYRNIAAVALGLALALAVPALRYWSLLLLAVAPRIPLPRGRRAS